MWLVGGPGLVLSGCFYIDPINRQPKVSGVERQCDADPCDFEDLHRGDTVRIKATFKDPDGPEDECTVRWRISACDTTLMICDSHRLYEDSEPEPAFVVPGTMEGGVPVQSVAVEFDVYDNRGASSSGALKGLVIKDGPTLALTRSAGAYTVGAPIDIFATYGDPDVGLPGASPSGVSLIWALNPLDRQRQAPLPSDLEVPQDLADPAHVTMGKRYLPPEAGDWDVRVIATNARGHTNEKHLKVTVEPEERQ